MNKHIATEVIKNFSSDLAQIYLNFNKRPEVLITKHDSSTDGNNIFLPKDVILGILNKDKIYRGLDVLSHEAWHIKVGDDKERAESFVKEIKQKYSKELDENIIHGVANISEDIYIDNAKTKEFTGLKYIHKKAVIQYWMETKKYRLVFDIKKGNITTVLCNIAVFGVPGVIKITKQQLSFCKKVKEIFNIIKEEDNWNKRKQLIEEIIKETMKFINIEKDKEIRINKKTKSTNKKEQEQDKNNEDNTEETTNTEKEKSKDKKTKDNDKKNCKDTNDEPDTESEIKDYLKLQEEEIKENFKEENKEVKDQIEKQIQQLKEEIFEKEQKQERDEKLKRKEHKYLPEPPYELINLLKELLKKTKQESYEPTIAGNRININKFAKYNNSLNKKIFEKKTGISDISKRLVYLLIDASGSMYGNKLNKAKEAAEILAKATEELKDNLIISSYNDYRNRRNRNYIKKVKFLNEKFNREFLKAVSVGGNTPTTVSIWGAFNEIKKLPHKEKLILVLTDGIATWTDIRDEKLNTITENNPRQVNKLVDWIKKQGISVFGIGIGKDISEKDLAREFGKQYLSAHNIEELPEKLANLYFTYIKH